MASTLLPSDTGEWLVSTASGARYLLDLDAHTATRLADDPTVDGTVPDDELAEGTRRVLPINQVWPLARLRRDGEAVRLVDFDPIKVGHVAVLVLQKVMGVEKEAFAYAVGADPITYRLTTPVVSIRRRVGSMQP